MEEQTLYDELVNGLREIEKNVITDLNAGQASGSWMGRIVSNEAPANYLNVQITEIQRTGMISVQADTVVKNKIVGIQKIEIGKEDVMKNGVTSFENKDFLDHLKSNSRSLETVSESITDKGDQRFMVFQTGQKENSLREHYKWLKSNGYNEFPEEDGKASAPAAAPTKKINREIKFNVPKGLTKAEFENTIKFFKENGAKYHVDEKIWTIKESQREKFAQYLNPENMHAAPKNEPQSSEERVRLNIPRYLKPDEFKNLIQYFKKNGAKYEPEEKAWFVEKSKIEVFEKYIKTEENEKDTDTQSWWTPEKEYYQTEEELQKMDPEAAESMRQFFRDHVNNHKAYIQSWTKALSEKPEMLMKAIRDAEKAANYLEYHAEILSKEEYQETLTLHENEETPGNASGKTVEKITNSITREADLKANGYKLTPALKKHMDRLDQLTGRKNTVKDIYKAYKTHDFHGDPETEKTIKSIGKIFQRQEMQIKAVIPER